MVQSVFCLSLTGNVFERFHNTVQWVYVSHSNPSDVPVVALTTLRGGTGTFFASDLAGAFGGRSRAGCFVHWSSRRTLVFGRQAGCTSA